MRPAIAIVCAFAFLAAHPAIAAADPPAVETAAVASIPQLGICRMADAENIEIQYAVEKLVFEAAPNAAVVAPRVDGLGQGRVAPTEARPTVEQRVRLVAIGQVVVQRPDGSAVSKDDLLKALAKPTPILLGKTGQKIDPLFLGLLKPDALVLLLPEEQRAIAAQKPNPQNPNPLAQPARPANPTPASPAPAIPAVPRKFGS